MDKIALTILPIFLMIALGYFLKRINLLSKDSITQFNNLVLYVLLPAMIFNALYSSNLSLIGELGLSPIIILLSSIALGGISYLILKAFGLDDRALWSVLIVIMMSNTGFMGYPICLGIFGNEGLVCAIFCDISTSILFLLLSFVLILKFGGSIDKAIRKFVFFPPLWAIVLGITFNLANVPIGPVFSDALEYLAGGVVPLIMISLGISIDFSSISAHKFLISYSTVIKLLAFPLVSFLVALAFGISGLQFDVTVLEAAMPSALLTLIIAVTYGLDQELTSNSVFVNTVISLITLPIILMIL